MSNKSTPSLSKITDQSQSTPAVTYEAPCKTPHTVHTQVKLMGTWYLPHHFRDVLFYWCICFSSFSLGAYFVLLTYGNGTKMPCKYLALALPRLAYYMHVMGWGLSLFSFTWVGRACGVRICRDHLVFIKRENSPTHNYKYSELKRETDSYSCLPSWVWANPLISKFITCKINALVYGQPLNISSKLSFIPY